MDGVGDIVGADEIEGCVDSAGFADLSFCEVTGNSVGAGEIEGCADTVG